MTILEWVRQALVGSSKLEPLGDALKKLHTIREAARNEFPTADIDVMLAEITADYAGKRK